MSNEKYGVEPGENTPLHQGDSPATEVNHSSRGDATNTPASSTGATPVNLTEQALSDFVAYMPNHTYINMVTGAHWPAASIDGRFPLVSSTEGGQIPPSKWLDKNRAVDQQIWDPGQPVIVSDTVMVAAAYVPKPGANIFNRYRKPHITGGNPANAGPWLKHLRKLYPNDYEHLECYLASKLQKPGIKINHALVLGGSPGIGKDTLLEPIKFGVGPGNWQEISPTQMAARFNGWAKTVMLRISEAYNQGQKEAQSFYELSKPLFAGPPDVIRIDEKNIPEYYVSNVCGVVITTNNRTDALYLPADDRRHYVAWSEVTRDTFPPDYWDTLYRWLENGGKEHVVAYLLAKDISGFDPKEPPPKTAAFWGMVSANESPESAELREALDHLGSPDVVWLNELTKVASTHMLMDLLEDLADRKQRKSWGARLAKMGYVTVRNPDTKEGHFKVNGKYCVMYAKKDLSLAKQIQAARSAG